MCSRRRTTRRRLLSREQLPSGEVRLGLAWYTPAGWAALKAAASDAERLDDSFEDWERGAQRALAEFASGGRTIVPVDVDVEALIRWCAERSRPLDAAARAEYVTHVLEQPGRHTSETSDVAESAPAARSPDSEFSIRSAPLTEVELERLQAFLDGLANPDALSVEAMDGMFCALIAGPDAVKPGAYLTVLWGGELSEDAFATEDQARDIITLLMQHWNSIAAELEDSALHAPLVFEPGVEGIVGRDWARGFMRGVRLAPTGWTKLFTDENEGQALTIPLVAGEVDPHWPATPLTPEKNDELIALMGAGLSRAYRRFAAARRMGTQVGMEISTMRRRRVKIGRNEPCPCGSGRKYKQCCARSDGEWQ